MGSFIAKQRSDFFRKFSFLGLSFVWPLGLSLGMLSFDLLPGSAWISGAVIVSVSFMWPLIINIVPILFFVICMKFHVDYIIFPCAFIKAYVYSFSRCILNSMWGSGTWLASLLLCFSGIFLTPILIYLWFIKLEDGAEADKKSIEWILLFAVFIELINFFLIRPLLPVVLGRS